ncbi:MAG: hypothetical protein WC603_00990 [Candidatus Paceibacterota bacterium]|jgi:hypothetical protein
MKTTTFVGLIACIVACIVAGLLFWWIMFGNNPQSSKKELANAMEEIISRAQVLYDSNYYVADSTEVINVRDIHRRFTEWNLLELELGGHQTTSGLAYEYDVDNDYYSDGELTQNIFFYLSNDSTKIIMHQFVFADYEGASGAHLPKYREFRNADDFTEKAGRLIDYRLENLASTEDPNLLDYYPAFNWRNMNLGFKDYEEGYKYKE